MLAIVFVACLVLLLVEVQGFRSLPVLSRGLMHSRGMGKISENVEFDTVAREWRLKWSPDNDKKALESVQLTLQLFKSAIKRVPGVKSVQRVVCGGCHDFKVIVALEADKFASWVSIYMYFRITMGSILSYKCLSRRQQTSHRKPSSWPPSRRSRE